MATNFELTVESRSDVGKGASRRLRRTENRLPAIVYGAGVEPERVSLVQDDLIHALENEAFYSHILTLKHGKKEEQVVLKDLQRHPYKKMILHADFLRVRADEALYMNIPLHFVGEEAAPGIKVAGGVATHHMTEIEVKCLPVDLPEYIEVDVSKLELNDSLHLKDIIPPKGVEFVELSHDDETNPLVLAIHMPRIVEEPENNAAPEAPETEITGEKALAEGEVAEKSDKPEKSEKSDKSK